MKKVIFGIVAMLIMVSCAGKGGSEKANEDSLQNEGTVSVVDTAAGVEDTLNAPQADEASGENDEAFANAVKALENIGSASNIDKYLKNLGFEGSKKTSKKREYDELVEQDIEVNVVKYNYTLKAGDKTIIYQSEVEDAMSWGNSKAKITIEGDEEALDNFYKAIKKKTDGEVTKKGNTVIIEIGWA